MTLDDFWAQIQQGTLTVRMGEQVGALLSEGTGIFRPQSAEDITAEAFSQDVFDSDTMTWDDALALVKARMLESAA
jgi:hypothetical protein